MWVCWGFVLQSILLFLCAVYTQHIPRTGGLKIYLTEFPPVGLCAQRCITGNFAARLAQGDVPLDTNWLKMFENSPDSSFLERYKLQLGYCISQVIIRWKWVALKQLVIFTMFQAFHTVVWVLQVRPCMQWVLVLQCNMGSREFSCLQVISSILGIHKSSELSGVLSAIPWQSWYTAQGLSWLA